MAHELGLFHKYNLNVTLHRELGWASIRDKIIFGELDAAHAIAAMPIAATLGLGSIPCDCLTALIFNLHGNAITLSNKLWQRGVRDGHSLRAEMKRSPTSEPLTFGVVYPFSSHRYLLRKWFSAHGIDPDRDVRLVVVPPAQMVTNLKAGNLDGFCVGEPWNSVAVQANAGWCVSVSAELSPGHPEKVLMVRREFSEKRETEHLSILAALIEASEFCDAPQNVERIVETLARPEYVGTSLAALRCGVSGHFDFGHGVSRNVENFCVFHRNGANEPSDDKAAWVLEVVRDSGLCGGASPNRALGRNVFRPDIYDKALQQRLSTSTHTYEKNLALA